MKTVKGELRTTYKSEKVALPRGILNEIHAYQGKITSIYP